MIRTPLQRRYLLANQILDLIRNARFEPGHHLREQALGDLLQVSRTPVRAALKLLEEQDILEARPNQGFFLKALPERVHRAEMEIPPTSDQDLYTRIVRDRLAGHLAPSFTQSDVARRYEAERATVQRTLARLIDDGLLQKNAGRGFTFLPMLDSKLGLQGSYDFRRMIEPAALQLSSFRIEKAAIERSRSQHFYLISHPDIESVDRRELFETDVQFHEMLAECSGNPFHLQAVQHQNRLRRLLEFGGYTNRRRVKDWCREHMAILDRISQGEIAEASRLLDEHLRNAFAQSSVVAAA